MKSWIGIIAVSATAALAGASLADKEADLTKMTGAITIDGSSTVYPITEAVAEEFAEVAPRVRVSVGISGTGGGFKRFCAGETDISDASRPIKKKEYDLAKENKIDFVEIPVAYDGLTIVVNKENDWVDDITVDELKEIFLADSTAKNWSDIRAGWPDTPSRSTLRAPIPAPSTTSRSSPARRVDPRRHVRLRGRQRACPRRIRQHGCHRLLRLCLLLREQEQAQGRPGHERDEAIMPTRRRSRTAPTPPSVVRCSSTSRPRPWPSPRWSFVDFYLEHAGDLAQEVGCVRLPKGSTPVPARM